MDDLNECCGASPTVFMPMWWGNKQIDESLTPHVECGKCGRVCHGKTVNQAYDNWNSIDELESKKGAQFSISNQSPETFDESGFKALEYTPVGEVTDLGENKPCK